MDGFGNINQDRYGPSVSIRTDRSGNDAPREAELLTHAHRADAGYDDGIVVASHSAHLKAGFRGMFTLEIRVLSRLVEKVLEGLIQMSEWLIVRMTGNQPHEWIFGLDTTDEFVLE
jgi:hypothetical protein